MNAFHNVISQLRLPGVSGPAQGESPGLCRRLSLAAAVSLLGAAIPAAGAAVSGAVTPHQSPHGVEEHCVILDRMPGGVYRAEDKAQEKFFCDIDFYEGSHALCPKVFSTSPGTLVYDISRGTFAGKPKAFEKQQCATSRTVSATSTT